MEKIVEKYFRPKLPHIWCPGCGNGIVTGAIAQAIDKMQSDPGFHRRRYRSRSEFAGKTRQRSG